MGCFLLIARAHSYNRLRVFHKTHNEEIKMRSKHFAWHLNALTQCKSNKKQRKEISRANGKEIRSYLKWQKPIGFSANFTLLYRINCPFAAISLPTNEYEISYSYVVCECYFIMPIRQAIQLLVYLFMAFIFCCCKALQSSYGPANYLTPNRLVIKTNIYNFFDFPSNFGVEKVRDASVYYTCISNFKFAN